MALTRSRSQLRGCYKTPIKQVVCLGLDFGPTKRLRDTPPSLHPAREAAARATRRTCAAEAAGLAQRRCCAHHDHAREGRGYGVQGRFNLHTMRGLARTKRRHEAVVFSRGLPWPHRTQRGLCAITSEENSVVASTQTRPCAASESPVARSSCRG